MALAIPSPSPAPPDAAASLTGARIAHAELSQAAALLRRALLARTEQRLVADPAALDAEQIAHGVKILQDLVSIEKTLLANRLLVDHIQAQEAARQAAQLAARQAQDPDSAPPAPASPATPNLPPPPAPPNTPSAPPTTASPYAQAAAAPDEPPAFAISKASFIPYRLLAPQLTGIQTRLAALDAELTAALGASPGADRAAPPPSNFPPTPATPNFHASPSTLHTLWVPPVAPCPAFAPGILSARMDALAARIEAFPPRKLSPEWQNPDRPDYTRPAPNYKPPLNNQFPIGKPHPTLRRDPGNPGEFRWVYPKPKRRDTS